VQQGLTIINQTCRQVTCSYEFRTLVHYWYLSSKTITPMLNFVPSVPCSNYGILKLSLQVAQVQPPGRVSVCEEAPGFRRGPRVKPMKRAGVRPFGGESLPGNIAHFLAYFVPRKLGTPSLPEMKECVATLTAGAYTRALLSST